MSTLNFSSFASAVGATFVPLNIHSGARNSFRGSLRTTKVDALTFTELHASAHEVERTAQLLTQASDGYYMVGVMVQGSGLLVQSGRELVLHEGAITVYDTAQPFSLSFAGDSKNFVVMLPKSLLTLPEHLISEITATELPNASRAGSLAAQVLMQVPHTLHPSFREVNLRIAHTTVDLIEALLMLALGAERLEQHPHQRLLRNIRNYIDAHLGSSDLNPAQIAAAHHISARHLHGLFGSQSMTVSGYIRTRRLERCRSDLLNPVFAHHPVSAIAARHGFTDAAHFSRVFRAHFQMTPTEMRATR